MRRSFERDTRIHQLAQRPIQIVGGDLDAVAGLDHLQRQIERGRGQRLARQLQQHVREMLAQQRARRALRDDLAAIHDRDLIAQQFGLFHVVRREDDGLAPRLDGLHQLPEIAARLRVEPGGGLVQEQHRRVIDERDREQQALLLPARELARITALQLLKRTNPHDLIDRQAP